MKKSYALFAGLIFAAFWLQPALALDVRFGAFIIKGSPSGVIFEQFKDNVDASGANIDLQLYIRGEVGPEEEMLSAVRRGRLDMMTISSLSLSRVVPEIAMVETPYLFSSLEEASFAMENYAFDFVEQLLAEHDLTLLRWIDLGYLGIYARTPILTPANVKDIRLRASASKSSQFFFEALGADLIFTYAPDTLPSLQTGMFVGSEGLIITYVGTGLDEEAPHFTLTDHSYLPALFIVNRQWWERQSEDIRDTLDQSFPPGEITRQVARDFFDAARARGEEGGVTFHDLDDATRAEWKSATANVRQRMLESIGGRSAELLELIVQGKAAYAAQGASADGNGRPQE